MYYPEELKLEIVNEVLQGRITQAEASRKYSIKGHSTILKWLKKYGTLPDSQINKGEKMSIKEEQLKKYEERISKLEKILVDREIELENEKLKARLYDRMINLAERDYKIKIKKNIGLLQ